MACKCKEDLEAKLLARFQSKEPTAKDHSVELDGYTLVMQGNSLVLKGCMNISTEAAVPLKKTGAFKQKKSSGGNMIFTFCPFCGERYDGVTAEAGPSVTDRAEAVADAAEKFLMTNCGSVEFRRELLAAVKAFRAAQKGGV